MARTAKRLCQTALSSDGVSVYTADAATTTQVVEIWIANTGVATRKVSLYVGGSADSNLIVPEIEVAAKGTKIISDAKIVLNDSVLHAKQDAGTDIILTAFGVEEV